MATARMHDGARARSLPVDVDMRAARSAFLATGKVPSGVRPVIAQSWLRSRLAGFDPAVPAAPRAAGRAELAAPCRAVVRELDARAETLRSAGIRAILVDAGAVVQRLWAPEGTADLRLVRSGVESLAGSGMCERLVGTHAVNVALDTESAAQVTGHEHLHEAYVGSCSVAMPLVSHPGGRVVGAVSLETMHGRTVDLLLPWLREIVRAAGDDVSEAPTPPEHTLMESFRASRRYGRRPIICLDHQTLVCNAAAARLLGPSEQAVLWEHASRVQRGAGADALEVLLADGREYEARFETVPGASALAGVKITLHACRDRVRSAERETTQQRRDLASVLPGRSRRWTRFLADLEWALSSGRPVLLTGESGVGKAFAARAALGDVAEVIDARDRDVVGACIVERLARGPVVLSHGEALRPSLLSELATATTDRGLHTLVVTFTDGDSARQSEEQLPPMFVRVRVPSLRDLADDVPDLVKRLTVSATPAGAVQVRWMSDAVQVLTRADWAENVRSLQEVVRWVVESNTTGYVDSRSLPEGLRRQASGRRLTRLEQLEAAEILASLREVAGNKLEAARRLGIARSTLYRRMRALGLDLENSNY